MNRLGGSLRPGATLRAIQDERCTAVYGVPTMFIAELEHPGFARRDFEAVKRTGIMSGSPCPIELMQRVRGSNGGARHDDCLRSD